MTYKKNIRSSFFLTAAAVTLAFLIASSSFYLLSRTQIHRLVEQYADNLMEQIGFSVSDIFYDTRTVASHLANSRTTEQYLLPEDDYDIFLQHRDFDALVETINISNNMIDSILLFRTDGFIDYHHQKPNSSLSLAMLAPLKNRFSSITIPDFYLFHDPTSNQPLVAYIQPIFSLSGSGANWNRRIGLLMVIPDMDKLVSLLNTSSTDTIYGLSIVDQQGNILLQSDSSPSISATTLFYPITDFSWKISYQINWREATTNYSFIRYILLLTPALFLVLIYALLKIYNTRIIRPITQLHKQAQEIINGNQALRLTVPRQDEIGALGSMVNSVLDSQEAMSRHLIQVQREYYESMLREKENRLHLLENQMNTHFILNTLQCVCGIATAYDIPPIVDIVSSMGKIFQYSLRSQEIVTLEEEFQIAEQYMKIIDIRFGRRYSWDFHLPDTYKKHPFPKMCLQPLAENAITHGLGQMAAGSIAITCAEAGDMLYIHVHDNGSGIPQDQLSELNRIMDNTELLSDRSLRQKRIGLANVCLRIKEYFGDASGITILSDEKGTTVTIRCHFLHQMIPLHPAGKTTSAGAPYPPNSY